MKEYDIETVIAIAEVIDPTFIGADVIRQAAKIAEIVTSERFTEQKEYKKVPPGFKPKRLGPPVKEPVSYFDTHDPIDQLGEYIKREKISMSTAARDLGVSTSSVAFWLKKKWAPGPRNIAKIKKYLS
jgi:hypothetical protein